MEILLWSLLLFWLDNSNNDNDNYYYYLIQMTSIFGNVHASKIIIIKNVKETFAFFLLPPPVPASHSLLRGVGSAAASARRCESTAEICDKIYAWRHGWVFLWASNGTVAKVASRRFTLRSGAAVCTGEALRTPACCAFRLFGEEGESPKRCAF